MGLRRFGLCVCLALAAGLVTHSIVHACIDARRSWNESYDQVDVVVRGRVDEIPRGGGLLYLSWGFIWSYRVTTIEQWKGPNRGQFYVRSFMSGCPLPFPHDGFEYLIMANEGPLGLTTYNLIRIESDPVARSNDDVDRSLVDPALPPIPLAEVYAAFGHPSPPMINPLRGMSVPGSWMLVAALLLSVAMRFGARSRTSEALRRQVGMGRVLGRSAGMWSGMATGIAAVILFFGAALLELRDTSWSVWFDDLKVVLAIFAVAILAGGLPGALIGRLLGAAAGRVAANRPEVNPRRIGVTTASVAALLGVWALQGTLLFSPLLGLAELIAVGLGWVAGRRFEEMVQASQG